MNKITITGRIVADAELRHTAGGDAIASFRLADDVGYGDKKTTNWINCNIWGKRGEGVAPHLTKGAPVTVFGTLTIREYDDKEGVKRQSNDIRVDEIVLQGGKKESDMPAQNSQSARKDSAHKAAAGDFNDFSSDVPF